MLKETMTYTDYNGKERTETFYFHLSKAETMEMELGTEGGLGEMIEKIVASKDFPTIIGIFKKFVLKAYGEKSLDGRRFMKSEEIATAFSQTEAYVQLFMKLSTDAAAAAAFVNGVLAGINPEAERKEAVTTPPQWGDAATVR